MEPLCLRRKNRADYHGATVNLLHVACFLLLSLLTLSKINAQQPGYFYLGQDQFKGVKIYDVIQDRTLNYYFSTNEGVYVFDFYSYKKISCPDCKGNSFFNFVISPSGIIYCNNLNNQIYKIENEKLHLIYELKKEEENPDLGITVVEGEEVLISGRMIIVIDPSGQVQNRYSSADRYIGQPFHCRNSEVVYHIFGTDSIIIYHNKMFRKERLKNVNEKLSSLHFYRIGDQEYSIDQVKKIHFRYNSLTHSLEKISGNGLFERTEAIRIYETGKDIWFAGTLPGISRIPGGEYKKILFEDHFISDVYKDHEGNLLFSTFEKGILVVPEIQIRDVIFPSQEDPVVSLFFHPGTGLIAGTSKGKLLQLNGNTVETISTTGTRPIEVIAVNKSGTSIIFDNGHIRFLDLSNNKVSDILLASLKDVTAINENLFILGTNRGILKVEKSPSGKFKTDWMAEAKYRIYSLEYHPEEKLIYASGSEGFICIDEDGNLRKIQNNGKDQYPNFLYYSNGSVYSAGKDGTIWKVKNGKIEHIIHVNRDGNPIELHKFFFYNQTIIGKSTSGLHQFSHNGNYLQSIQEVYFIKDKRIIDFTIFGDSLWISHENGLQNFDLKRLKISTEKPRIEISKIEVNDQVIPAESKNTFNNDERKIRFILYSPSIKNSKTTSYHFKLEGYDHSWNVFPYENNEVVYTALAPGDYTFIVKAKNREVFSDPITYSFSIAPPVYLKWWFMLLAGLLFTAATLLIYKRQLRIQQKKSAQINELHLSKLAAIQSQMNPHFIFNSLNSIQDLILKGDVENSYSFITTFSNLVRKTLKYSEKDFIDFEEDIQLLELYLSLEKLRFKKDFSYSMEYYSIDEILIPPMLIQPFVENALIHGLLHKEGEKRLSLKFELREVLICEITDNGIGREAAAAVQKRQRAGHESFAGNAIRNRFQILSEVYGGEFDYQYEDLKEINGHSGTRVILRIPYKQKY